MRIIQNLFDGWKQQQEKWDGVSDLNRDTSQAGQAPSCSDTAYFGAANTINRLPGSWLYKP
jgi:hypothetical protein